MAISSSCFSHSSVSDQCGSWSPRAWRCVSRSSLACARSGCGHSSTECANVSGAYQVAVFSNQGSGVSYIRVVCADSYLVGSGQCQRPGLPGAVEFRTEVVCAEPVFQLMVRTSRSSHRPAASRRTGGSRTGSDKKKPA